MARHLASVLVAGLLCGGSATAATLDRLQAGHDQQQPGARQDTPRWKWWLNPESRKELELTDQQSAQIEQIFESTVPRLRATWRELEQLEAALSQMIKENAADVATVTQQVERVESVRAEHNKLRTVMLYRINLHLSPEQRVKVEALRARRDENRRKQGDRFQPR
jgi:Spy/CpxP family protein refolding chaperone